MHDRPVIVADDVDAVVDMLLEIVDEVRIDVGEGDLDELVAVGAALLVPETDGVAELVNDVADHAAVGEDQLLLAAAPADRRGAAARHAADEDIVLLRGPRLEVDGGIVLPMLDRVEDALLVGDGRVDRVGDGAVRPAELAALDGDALGADVRLGEELGHRLDALLQHDPAILHLGGVAEDDAALEDRAAFDVGVGDLLPRLGERLHVPLPEILAAEETFLAVAAAHRACPPSS